MATQLGINPNTVKKAYSILEQKGIIVSLSTKGTYITQNIDDILKEVIDKKISEIKETIKEIEKYGMSKDEILNKIMN